MDKNSRMSINIRQSFVLPKRSDVFTDTTVFPDEVDMLRDLSVAARPSLMQSPDTGPAILEDSNVPSAELRRRFPDDHEWYKRLSNFSQPSFTPRTQRKALRLPNADGASEEPSDESGREVSVAGPKPFRKKKALFNHSDYDKVLDSMTLPDDESLPQPVRSLPNVSLAKRRSMRLQSTAVDSSSPVESPREKIRRWKSTVTRRNSWGLSEAIQGLRKSHEGVTINESQESAASVSNQPGPPASKNKKRQSLLRRKVSIFDIPVDKDNISSSVSENASVISAPARPKLFGKARESRYSIGAILDETSDSVEPTEQSSSRTPNRLNAASEETSGQSPRRKTNRSSAASEEVSIANAEDLVRHRLFAGKTRDKKRRYSELEKILDADDSERAVDESRENKRSTPKSARKENPASSKESRNFVAEESTTLSVERNFFAKHTKKTRGSYSEVLNAEESSTFSTRETAIVEGMPGTPVGGKIAANESQGPKKSVTPADSAHHVDVEVESTESASPKERRQLFAGPARKSRRSSAFVAVMEDDDPVTEAPTEEKSSPKKRRSEQQAQSPEQDTSHLGRPTERRWALAKGRERVDRYQEILSMDSSASSSSGIESENKENEPDFSRTDKVVSREREQKSDGASEEDEDPQSNAKMGRSSSTLMSPSKRKSTPDAIRSEVNRETSKQISESSFVVPAMHLKRSSLRQRFSGMELPTVEIPLSRIDAVTSTPTPNNIKMVLPSPMSTIKNSSKGSLENPSLEQSAKMTYTMSIAAKEGSESAGAVDESQAKHDSAAERRRSKRTSLSPEKLSRKVQRSDDILEKEQTGEGVMASPTLKSPPQRKSSASEQQSPNKRQSARYIERSETASLSSSEDSSADVPSSAERLLSLSGSKSSAKRQSRASEQQHLQNRKVRKSLRRSERSENGKASSTIEIGDKASPIAASAGWDLSQSRSKRALLKSRPSGQQESPSRQRQSARRMARSETTGMSSEEESEDGTLPSSAQRILTSGSKSSAKRKRKSTASERQKSPNKRQSARRMVQSEIAERSSEEENEGVLPSPSSKSRSTVVKDLSFRTSKSSSKRTSIFRRTRENERPSSRNADLSSPDGVEERKSSSIRKTSSIYKSATSSRRPASSVMEEKSSLDTVGESAEESNARAAKRKVTSDEYHEPQRTSPANSSTPFAQAALLPPPVKSAVPQRVRSDIRNFFVKSTPLKEHQPGDKSDSFVPFDATVITPIKMLSNLSAQSDEESLFLQGNAATGGKSTNDKDRRSQVKGRPGPSAERIQELMSKLMERLPKKKEEARPKEQEKVYLKQAKRTQSPKASAKKFQLILPDGKAYKQPKLAKPRKFVTEKMYKFITKNITNNSALDTRVRAEEFVTRLCDTYDKVCRRKNTKKLVEELLEDMVRLGLVSTYREFYSFVEKFLPFNFRIKAIPCIGSDLAPRPRKGYDEKL